MWAREFKMIAADFLKRRVFYYKDNGQKVDLTEKQKECIEYIQTQGRTTNTRVIAVLDAVVNNKKYTCFIIVHNQYVPCKMEDGDWYFEAVIANIEDRIIGDPTPIYLGIVNGVPKVTG